MFKVVCDNEKFSCDGSPTATLRLLDTVSMPVDTSFATTRTDVGTVPELIRTVTWPRLLVFCVTGPGPPSIVTPPTDVTSDSPMSRFGSGLPAKSRSSNVTFDTSPSPEPFRKITEGVAVTNDRLLTDGPAMAMLSKTGAAEEPTIAACNWSLDCSAPHPLSLYWIDVVGVVAVNVAGDIEALPAVTHDELKATFTGEPTEAPATVTVSEACP